MLLSREMIRKGVEEAQRVGFRFRGGMLATHRCGHGRQARVQFHTGGQLWMTDGTVWSDDSMIPVLTDAETVRLVELFSPREVCEYHGCTVRLYSKDGSNGSYTFDVIDQNGTLHTYSGVPNKWLSRQSARMRGWWRAKWLAEGTYDNHYKSF